MRRSGMAKFPNSVQLFKFCQKVLMDQKDGKVHDQEVGGILNFNPSDCSHWKRGEKNVKSVFALAKLADFLNVEVSLIHDIAMGQTCLDEGYYEYKESKICNKTLEDALSIVDKSDLNKVRTRVEAFVAGLHAKADFSTPPLYLPEVMQCFPFISTQAVDMMDKLSRVLRRKPGQYSVHFKKGELRPQTRMSIVRDLARIIFQAERSRFEILGSSRPDLSSFEELVFTATLLAPKAMLLDEMNKLDSRRNLISELAGQFWVPKCLIGFQLQDTVRCGRSVEQHADASQSAAAPTVGEKVLDLG